MKNSIFTLSVLAFALLTNAYGQKPVIELTFTANYYGQSVQFDSLFVENLTQGGYMMLYAPVTSLVLDYETGETENNVLDKSSFSVSANYPNPFATETAISIYLPSEDFVQIMIFNSLGQKVASYEGKMESGYHSFTLYSGYENNYFLNASVKGMTKSIKMVSLGNNTGKNCSLVYSGKDITLPFYKSQKAINDFVFSLGDQLRFMAYANTPDFINGSDVIEDAPQSNQNYSFDILEGIPCPGTPSVTFEEKLYRTVQIGTQCWLKENLNVGTMINGNINQTNNSQLEKYCYNNDIDNCDTYGGLYQWDEMMQYDTTPGTQGICPTGWHLPTEDEWIIFTAFLGGVETAGGKMKEVGTYHWDPPNVNATNESGFTGLGSGIRNNVGDFTGIGNLTNYWISKEYSSDEAVFFYLLHEIGFVGDGHIIKNRGNSVRCVKDLDMAIPCPGTPTVIYEGQTYNTVQIGDQCWLKENLNVGTMINGNINQTNNNQIEKYCYNNDITNCETYGGLYQWDEMMQYTTQQGTQGICPEGWHLPTETEVATVIDYLGGNAIAGGKMKEAGTLHWLAPNTGATNESGFTGLPGGISDESGYFNMGLIATFWTSTEVNASGAKFGSLSYINTIASHGGYDYKSAGSSVRCVKD